MKFIYYRRTANDLADKIVKGTLMYCKQRVDNNE